MADEEKPEGDPAPTAVEKALQRIEGQISSFMDEFLNLSARCSQPPVRQSPRQPEEPAKESGDSRTYLRKMSEADFRKLRTKANVGLGKDPETGEVDLAACQLIDEESERRILLKARDGLSSSLRQANADAIVAQRYGEIFKKNPEVYALYQQRLAEKQDDPFYAGNPDTPVLIANEVAISTRLLAGQGKRTRRSQWGQTWKVAQDQILLAGKPERSLRQMRTIGSMLRGWELQRQKCLTI